MLEVPKEDYLTLLMYTLPKSILSLKKTPRAKRREVVTQRESGMHRLLVIIITSDVHNFTSII